MKVTPLTITAAAIIGYVLLKEDRMQLNDEQIRKLKIHGSRYNLDFKNWTLLVIRGGSVDKDGAIARNNNILNEWNDLFVLIKGFDVKVYLSTCDPGRKWALNPINQNGTFRIEPGLYYYQKGKHDGKDAFNSASPISGRRDGNKDLKWNEKDQIYTDSVGNRFWINIHASYTGSRVDGSSAGCMVTKAGWSSSEWKEFRDVLYKEYGSNKFPVLVTESKDIV
ncbi:hypothetical protein [Leptospira ilyithenensis]|uniref:Murein L,D-transpeptidase catalytic domain family protein n=1 Tax=Leptospira ilyithenensis TaxID=2484901 RepID=A0A4R9LP89_9LEPT|nr:hypothetical protein [Leptospira ilyithenensis]TGN09760.1 hypothetical protein EHS11_11805 [Leptospira ilyithenensis]